MTTRDPAPGALETVRLFVNTVDLEGRDDRLTSPAALREVFAELGLLERDARLTQDDLARAVEVREAMRDLMEMNCGHSCTEDASDALNRAAARATLHLRFEPDATFVLEPRAKGGDAAIGRLLAIVFRSMADGTWERMKACGRSSCRWAFYDRSKNHSSKWCSMDVCGNREKSEKYRARHSHA